MLLEIARNVKKEQVIESSLERVIDDKYNSLWIEVIPVLLITVKTYLSNNDQLGGLKILYTLFSIVSRIEVEEFIQVELFTLGLRCLNEQVKKCFCNAADRKNVQKFKYLSLLEKLVDIVKVIKFQNNDKCFGLLKSLYDSMVTIGVEKSH